MPEVVALLTERLRVLPRPALVSASTTLPIVPRYSILACPPKDDHGSLLARQAVRSAPAALRRTWLWPGKCSTEYSSIAATQLGDLVGAEL